MGGLESWAGRGGDINEMYPNQLCVAPQPSRHLIMWCPCQASDDYGLILSIFTASFGNLNYSSLLIVIQERRRNSEGTEAVMETDSAKEAQDRHWVLVRIY